MKLIVMAILLSFSACLPIQKCEYKITAPFVDICEYISLWNCGEMLDGCKSKKKYDCVIDIEIQKVCEQ